MRRASMLYQDDERTQLVVNLNTGRIYAPYDGGADLLYANETERDDAGERFRTWGSWREDGL